MTWTTDREVLLVMHMLKTFEEGDEVRLKLSRPIAKCDGAGRYEPAYSNPSAICRLLRASYWYRSVSEYDYIAFYKDRAGIWVTINDIAAWRRKGKRR